MGRFDLIEVITWAGLTFCDITQDKTRGQTIAADSLYYKTHK